VAPSVSPGLLGETTRIAVVVMLGVVVNGASLNGIRCRICPESSFHVRGESVVRSEVHNHGSTPAYRLKRMTRHRDGHTVCTMTAADATDRQARAARALAFAVG
jgi:hypothetical protein